MTYPLNLIRAFETKKTTTHYCITVCENVQGRNEAQKHTIIYHHKTAKQLARFTAMSFKNTQKTAHRYGC